MFPYKKPHNWSEQQYQLAIRIHTLSMWMMGQKIWHEYRATNDKTTLLLLITNLFTDKQIAFKLSHSSNISQIQQQILEFVNESPKIIRIQAYDVVNGNTIFTLKVGDKYEAMG